MSRILAFILLTTLVAPCAAATSQGGHQASLQGTALARSDAPVPDLGDPDTRRPFTETRWFNFYSDFGFNVYDAVLTSATARHRDRPS